MILVGGKMADLAVVPGEEAMEQSFIVQELLCTWSKLEPLKNAFYMKVRVPKVVPDVSRWSTKHIEGVCKWVNSEQIFFDMKYFEPHLSRQKLAS